MEIKYLYKDRDGQSLVEVLVGLTIGMIIIGTAAFAITGTLRSNISIDRNQKGLVLGQDLLGKIRSVSTQNWQNLYGLDKGLSSEYFLNASGSNLFVVSGAEGVLDNDVSSGLVGEWKFDENVNSTSTVTYDSTGDNNNGVLTNSPTRASSTCKISNCLSFDGVNDYVLISDPADNTLDPTSQYSISTWVKTSSTSTYGFIVSKSNGGSGGGYELFMSSGSVRFSSCNSVGSCSGGYFDISTPLSYNDGNWHFIVATAETNTGVSIYVDGVLVKSSSVTQDNIQNSYNLLIGGRGTTGGNPFDGLIDDVRIYNRALSSDEVSQLYNSKIYTRSFSVENTCRTNDSTSTISGVSPCALGTSDDPSTQKISVITKWSLNGTSTQATLIDYITRWQNAIFEQDDWSGGLDLTTSTYTNTATTFSSSTNMATTTNGAIKLNGI